ncbi:MAG TPA: hypothetical protein VF985_02690 [Mariniflexile sp.]
MKVLGGIFSLVAALMRRKLLGLLGKTLFSSKEQGGLGIGSLKALNMALLAKWWWKIKIDNCSLWAATIKSIHGFFRRSPRDTLLSKKGGSWGSIISINRQLQVHDINLHTLFSLSDNGLWSWSLDHTGLFNVAFLRYFLDSKLLHNDHGFKTYWNRLIPGKISLHGWKVHHRRLATFENLLKRGIILDVKYCPFCELYPETEAHIFLDCFIAKV